MHISARVLKGRYASVHSARRRLRASTGLHGGAGAQNYVVDSVVHDRPAYYSLTEVEAPLA